MHKLIEMCNNERIIKLISKDLLGILDRYERVELTNWRSSSIQNEKSYLYIKRRIKNRMKAEDSIQIDKEWKQFRKTITAKSYFRFLCSIACSIILFVGFIAIYKYTNISHNIILQEPALHNVATLELSDGKIIGLMNSDQDFSIENGIGVVSGSRGLKYAENAEQHDSLLKWNIIRVPRGAEYFVTLSDGSKIWLNSETMMKYPINFSNHERKIYIDGEICCNIAKNDQIPFIIESDKAEVKVYGTIFNFESYSDSEKCIATLIQGSIGVIHKTNEYFLVPNEQFYSYFDSVIINNVKASDYIGWTKGLFHFDHVPLSDIMQRLSRWYDVDYVFENESMKNINFTIDIERYDDIKSILTKISKTGRVIFEYGDKYIYIKE